ncbi:hypothetical protein LPJ53_005207 [Coemansia erecta]|uniref:Ras-GAP domain-containing protein n=1 Tax=Coemansia erecta TaxID=147472 RepID=A0A9W7XWU5_9FUNG|nr:hypothetical protein LPJ53_005207 [Coemansia erecta]
MYDCRKDTKHVIAISRYTHSASARLHAIHRHAHLHHHHHHHHRHRHHDAGDSLDSHVPGLHDHSHTDDPRQRNASTGAGKSGYLMVWDKQQHDSHHHGDCGWVMEFCTITSTGEFVCLSKETSQPLVIFDLRTSVQRTIGSGAWGRQAIEIVDRASQKPIIYLRASTKAETAAWLLEMQCWAVSAGESLAQSPLSTAASVSGSSSGKDLGGGTIAIDHASATHVGIDAAEAAAAAAGSSSSIGISSPGDKDNKSEGKHKEKEDAGSATLLLPTHSRKPPQLVQALVHTMAPAAQKFRSLVEAYSHTPSEKEEREGSHHDGIFSYFSYPLTSIFTDIMQPCVPASSNVHILLAGMLYLRMHSSGDLFNPIAHVLARDGEWHPYIAVLARCEQCVSLLLYEVGESVVVEVADIDVQVLLAHDIQAEDDSLFESGSFGFHINLTGTSEFMPSGCNMANVIAGSSLGKDRGRDSESRSSHADDGCMSAKSAPTPTMDRHQRGRGGADDDYDNASTHDHAADHVLEPSDSSDTPLRAHFEDDGREHPGEGEAEAEAEGAGDSERKSRRRSRSLGHLIGIEGLSIGGHGSNKRSKHSRLLKHGTRDAAGHRSKQQQQQHQQQEKVKNSSHASISSTASHAAPSVLYLAALRAGERNNWIAQLRRYAQTAYSGAVERPLASPVAAPLAFRVERCMWIKIHEVQGLAKAADSAVALVVIDGHVVAQSVVTAGAGKTKLEPLAHFFGSLPPITRGVHVLVRQRDKQAQQGGGLMGYCQIPIPMLQRGCTYNGWYPLSHGNVSEIDQQIGSYLPLAASTKPAWRRWTSKSTHADGASASAVTSSSSSSLRPSTPFRSGDVHIQVRYDELVVLSSPFYTDIVTLLLDARPTLIFDLVAVLPRSADWLVETATKIAICSGRAVPWIEAIVQHELGTHRPPDPALVFRGASVATRAMDTLMKVVGLTFLDQMIGNVVRDVAKGSYHCEVDPARLLAKEDVNEHWRTLLHLQRALWLGIEESLDGCPPTLRRVFAGIRAVISQLYAGHVAHAQVRYSCISGFLFLRLVCPAMLSPKTFGLVGTHPDAQALRTLTLLAKGIQCTANLTDFALKEPYMQPMNQFVQQSVPKLKRYIDHVAGDPEDIVEADLDGWCRAAQAVVDDERMAIMAVDRERELAAFSDFLYLSREDVRRVIALSSPVPSSASSAMSAHSHDSAASDAAAASPQAQAAELEQQQQPADPDLHVAERPPPAGAPASAQAFSQRSAEPSIVTSAALSETHRLIESLVQACENVQECVDACLQSPYATSIQTPVCAKEPAI